jgi:uncharacterized membrane protein YeaQ/YmgE (transglycosylase-associated protein family)
MSRTSELPSPSEPDGLAPEPAPAPSPRRGVVVSIAILLGSVLIGAPGGLAWALLAPRVAYQVVSRGLADAMNPETSGFIAADAWFCLIGVICGLIIGVGGYLLGVRRHGPAPMAAILLGSVGAALVARAIGQSWGVSEFDRKLLTSPAGTVVHAPLTLGGGPSGILWPAVAFWPLAACLAAGALVLLFSSRGGGRPGRHRSARQSPLAWPDQGS